jgi:hypothetical protein
MVDSPSTPTRVPVPRLSWLLASAAAALGLVIAVAADGPGPSPDVPRTAADEDAAHRRLADESRAPSASHDDHMLDLLQRLVDGGQIPRATLE